MNDSTRPSDKVTCFISKNLGQKLREQVSPNGQGRHGQEEKTKVTPMEHKGHEADGEQEAEIVPADESKYLFHI